ncbi:MAG TPA: class D sortase [Acidimicrobiia bacterium]
MTDLDAVWAPLPPGTTEIPPEIVEPEPPPGPAPKGPRHERRERQRTAKHDVMRVLGLGLTIFGLVVLAYFLYLVGASRLEYGRTQRTLTKIIGSNLSAGIAPIGGRIMPGTPVAMLEIPRLHLHAAVVEGTNGALLKQGPGHLRTSPLPGQRGNVVIMGRRVAYGGPFRNVGRLREGDLIRASTGQGKFTYVVDDVHTTNRKGTDVLAKGSGNRLALVTSSPELFAERRLVVRATLRGTPKLTPIGRPNEVSDQELGLQSDGSTMLSLVLWTELLLVAAVGAAWAYRRWGRWNTWLVTTPVLALLLLLVFDSLTPVLPSTL